MLTILYVSGVIGLAAGASVQTAETAAAPPRVGQVWGHGNVVEQLEQPKAEPAVIRGTTKTDPNAPRHSAPFVPVQGWE